MVQSFSHDIITPDVLNRWATDPPSELSGVQYLDMMMCMDEMDYVWMRHQVDGIEHFDLEGYRFPFDPERWVKVRFVFTVTFNKDYNKKVSWSELFGA